MMQKFISALFLLSKSISSFIQKPIHLDPYQKGHASIMKQKKDPVNNKYNSLNKIKVGFGKIE